MSPALHRRNVLRASLAAGASLVFPTARACEFFAANLRITHPWTRATAQDAAFAIVCMKIDEVTRADRLIGVETPVAAGAEIGGADAGRSLDIVIPEGRETLFGETGTQIRLLGLKQPLEVARSYPLTLVFANAGNVAATLNVDYTRFR